MNQQQAIFLLPFFRNLAFAGLDSATSFHVINILKNLAKAGRTVIGTIHQPSSEIFDTFDKILLMVQGKIIYQVN